MADAKRVLGVRIMVYLSIVPMHRATAIKNIELGLAAPGVQSLPCDAPDRAQTPARRALRARIAFYLQTFRLFRLTARHGAVIMHGSCGSRPPGRGPGRRFLPALEEGLDSAAGCCRMAGLGGALAALPESLTVWSDNLCGRLRRRAGLWPASPAGRREAARRAEKRYAEASAAGRPAARDV